VNAGDQLELRLAEVGRDMRMGERRAEPGRMRRRREIAVRADPQALLLDAAQQLCERTGRQRAQAFCRINQAAPSWKQKRRTNSAPAAPASRYAKPTTAAG